MSWDRYNKDRYNRGRRLSGPRAMGELMGATLGTARIAKGIGRARAILAWPGAVGPEIARITRPRTQQGSVLFVDVRDSAAAHHLSMQRHHFLKALNALLPDAPISDIRFSVGSVREAVIAPAPAPLPAPDRARAHELVQAVHGPLRSAALRAAEAITRSRRWRQEQGWRPCPVCGEASQEQPCRACTLTLDDPNVKRAARLLMQRPEYLGVLPGTLGDSGANAARYSALRRLEEQLDLLALECVRSGQEDGYQEFLAQQAGVYLALHLRCPRADLKRSDRAQLPERARNVLNAGR